MTATAWNYILLVVLVSDIALTVGLAYFKKGKPFDAGKAISAAETAVHALEPVLSVTPFAPFVHIMDEALRAAETGVRYAEQLFKNDNTLDRKAVATDYVANAVKQLGIEITPQVASILDGAIESAVLFLPKTNKAE